MYSGRGFREWEIGDIDIIKEGDTYHLFHLVLPNHDYIAHATSRDCINWKRVKNALFVGDPGEWDDDMLWTMNVIARDGGGFEMFYTGLSQEEEGSYQRIGYATSPDLFEWTKKPEPPFPIEPEGPHYESRIENIRQWVSFRDPFHYRSAEGERFILVCARTNHGAISRRGCVGLLQLKGERAVSEKPLFVPFAYDDVECPALFEMNGRSYLIGSIREDIKVHYWHADSFRGEYLSFPDNILLPRGNYAARVTSDNGRLLLYSFFVAGEEVEIADRYFCPPKELTTDPSGRLVLRSFQNWQQKISARLAQAEWPEVTSLFGNPSASLDQNPGRLRVGSRSGYEIFALENQFDDFIWRGRLSITEPGKFGLVFHANQEADGYYLSIEPIHGLIQIRAWTQRPENLHKDYLYQNLQSNSIRFDAAESFSFELLCYGHYIEFSVDGVVKLSLVDGKLEGDRIGLYCNSAEMELTESVVMELKDSDEDELSQQFESSAGDWQNPAYF